MATQDKAEKLKSNGRKRKDVDDAGFDGETGKPVCFVIMPISDPDNYEPGHFDRVYEDIFVPACDQAGFRAVRADQVKQTNLIHLDVLQKLVESPMALCDLSNRNPNVLFELGLRQAFDKPVVLVQEEGTLPIFDIAPLRYAEYHRELKYREVLQDQKTIGIAIKETLRVSKDHKNVNSLVKLLALSQPASLPDLKEAEKDPVLQLVRAEIGALRQDFMRGLTPAQKAKSTGSLQSSADDEKNVLVDLIRLTEEARYLQWGWTNRFLQKDDVLANYTRLIGIYNQLVDAIAKFGFSALTRYADSARIGLMSLHQSIV